MPIQILMPALSPTMTEGTLSRWLKKEGDNVKTGDVIAEIETDKATIEFEATNAGVIDKFLVTEGTQGIAVDTPIAVLLPFDHGASLRRLHQLKLHRPMRPLPPLRSPYPSCPRQSKA